MLPDEPQLPDPEDLQPHPEQAVYPDSAAEPMPEMPPKDDGQSAAAAGPAPRKLTYVPAIRFVFENPQWFVSLVFASLCLFIPVIGQVVLWGFFFEIVESLYRQPRATYPKFDFNRFGVYCVRGVWPFVLLQAIQVTLQLILQLPIQFAFQGMFILLATNQQVGAIVLAIGLPLLVLFLLTLGIGISVLTAPMLLRAGLTQDVRQVFRFDWFKVYWKKVWVEEVLSTLFIMVAGVVLLPLGCMVFCVGFFAASVVMMIASAHLKWQIYEIYLERGGEPIPLHPLPAEEPPLVAPGQSE